MHAVRCLLITDPNELTLIKVIGQGTFGVVPWRGSLVAAKVIPVSPTELKSDVIRREIDILRLMIVKINLVILPMSIVLYYNNIVG